MSGIRLIGASVVFAAALALFLSLFRIDNRPEWKRRLDEGIPFYVWRPGTKILETERPICEKIHNDLIRRDHWGTDETQELFSIIRRGYPADAHAEGASPEAASQYLAWLFARDALYGRLALRAPIADEAARQILDWYLTELESPDLFRRVEAGADLIELGHVKDPTIRSLVENLLDDPASLVAEDIAFLLARYDEQRAKENAAADKRSARDRP